MDYARAGSDVTTQHLCGQTQVLLLEPYKIISLIPAFPIKHGIVLSIPGEGEEQGFLYPVTG